MPLSRTSILNHGSLNPSGNFLAGFTPIFAGWTQDPGTNADLVQERSKDLTTNGIQTNSVTSTITYDFGSLYRIIVFIHRYSVTTGTYCQIETSTDGINYEREARSQSTTLVIQETVIVRTQYLRFSFNATNPGNTHSRIHLRAYLV